MRCHHPSDRTTCDSNRDGMTAGCWLDWCACFSSGFTDLDKQKPGLPPDSPTGCWSSTAVWSVWVETSCSLLYSFRFRTWGVYAGCCSLSVKCQFAFLDFGCPAGQTDWLKTHWRIWEKKPSVSSVSYFCYVSNCNFHVVERNLICFFFFFFNWPFASSYLCHFCYTCQAFQFHTVCGWQQQRWIYCSKSSVAVKQMVLDFKQWKIKSVSSFPAYSYWFCWLQIIVKHFG